jgi:hypothetical protein
MSDRHGNEGGEEGTDRIKEKTGINGKQVNPDLKYGTGSKGWQ